jgi:hypothetical protein
MVLIAFQIITLESLSKLSLARSGNVFFCRGSGGNKRLRERNIRVNKRWRSCRKFLEMLAFLCESVEGFKEAGGK